MTAPVERSGEASVRLQTWVLAVGIVLMGGKFLAWRLTGSSTILSDALESIVNVVAGCFALYSLILAAKPRDTGHPYGHGKVEFLSAGFEGGLVMLAGALIIWSAGKSLVHPLPLRSLDTGILITAGTGVINLLMGLALRKRGREQFSLTMEASGAHLLSDAWSTAAMIVGLIIIRITGIPWLDGVFAIAFAIYIIITGLRILRRSVAGMMDEADLDLAAQVIAVLEQNRKPQWVDVHNFRMIKYGAVLHIDCHVTLPWYYSLEQAHDEIAAMEKLVNAHCAQEVELFIHMDPCIPTSCRICSLEGCPQRKAEQAHRITWQLGSVLDNAKHGSKG